MEEIKKILDVSIFRNSDDNDVVRINEESRVIVVIDNEDNFKDVFSKDGEVDLFKQLLSQEVQRYYSQDKVFPVSPLVGYKVNGDIIFDFVEVNIGKLYDGYVYVVHYNFASTIS